jgi:hypothetical protein
MNRHIILSNRQITTALNSNLQLLIPWPEECLGPYGKNSCSDKNMDEYITSRLEMPNEVTPPLRVMSIIPGITDDGTPVIVVRIGSPGQPSLGPRSWAHFSKNLASKTRQTNIKFRSVK